MDKFSPMAIARMDAEIYTKLPEILRNADESHGPVTIHIDTSASLSDEFLQGVQKEWANIRENMLLKSISTKISRRSRRRNRRV